MASFGLVLIGTPKAFSFPGEISIRLSKNIPQINTDRSKAARAATSAGNECKVKVILTFDCYACVSVDPTLEILMI